MIRRLVNFDRVTVSRAAVAALATLALVPGAARADDTVRACIASSTEGQTLRKDGKLLAAREAMIACARDACPGVVRAQCARWLAVVEAANPSVVVRAQEASGEDAIGARLAIDGRPARLDGQPVRLDPGPHAIAIESGRGARKEERVLLVEGEGARRLTLRFADAASAASAPPPTARPGERRVPLGAWVLGGVGLVALGSATYLGLAAKGDLDTLDATCSPRCTSAQTQPGRTDAAFFDATLAVGGAAVVGARVWALAFPERVPRITSSALLEVRPARGGALTALTIAW